ncbi:MAG: response regulator transcription factor [Bacteriovorax sp.]|nr:response regulator transcription factor [Bacteriovorax sp.]
MNILIAEDEPAIANKVMAFVQELRWTPTIVHNIPSLLEVLSNSKITFEILVLDRMMDSLDSADYITSLRMQYPTLKIFVLSAIDSSHEKAKLINTGADDYLAKPFESSEFKARLRSLLRRSVNSNNNANLNYELANTSLDLIQRSVTVNGKHLNLTAKEFLVLHALCGNAGKIYSKNQLIQTIWGFSLENETNVVESTINSLRRKLEHEGSVLQIKNTRFIGYWIEI